MIFFSNLVVHQFAYYGPSPKHDTPAGGFCISVFAVIRRGNKVLLVKPTNRRKWLTEWSPNIRLMNQERLKKFTKSWLFPGGYVREGEAPEEALKRILKEQLGIKSFSAGPGKLYNFYDPSNIFPGNMHWDYCFVFKVKTNEEIRKRPWFSSIEFVDPRDFGRDDFTSAQGDLALAIGLIGSRK